MRRTPDRILHLERDGGDARHVEELLRAAGIAVELERVTDLPSFKAALERGAPSLILSELSPPEMDAFEALRWARAACPEVPFIFEHADAELLHAAELLELGDALLELDRHWRIVRVNANQERFTRTKRADTVGRITWEVWPESARPDAKYWRELHRCMEERVPVQFDEYFAPLDLWTAVTAYPTSTGGIAVFFRNIGARRRAEEALRRREMTLAQAGQMAHLGAWDIEVLDADDLNKNALTWSDEVYRIFGYEPRAVAVSNELFFQHVHPDDRAGVSRAVAQAIAERRAYSVEHRIVRADGTQRFVQEHAELTFDDRGALVRITGAVQDVTERRLAEEALREAGRRKDEFLAMLAHELRNPLAPIRNSLYILDRVPPDGDHGRRARATIDRQVSHLVRLLDDLLDVSRITRGKIKLQRERVDLGEIVARTVEDHRALFAERAVELGLEQPEAPLWISGDATRLAQVLANLLQNAVKFTPRGGRTWVTLHHQGSSAILEVRDTGAGISPEIMGRLFEPFTQADTSLARVSGGLGLGLALVKGIVELHGGEVRANSQGTGRGAELTIRLPAELEVARRPRRRLELVKPSSRRVLVIEDNVDAAESLKEALEIDGHEVAVAFTGSEGLAKARAHRPDVVLCDIGLPGMDGYEVARSFRSDEGLKDIALVAVTGYADSSDRQRAARAGFDHHLAKPPDLEAIGRILAAQPGPEAQRGART